MNGQDILQSIPVVSVQPESGRRIHKARRAVQLGTLILAILIPVSGLFRIDPVEGAFVVIDRQIWFSDFSLVVGLWLAISCSLVMTYSLVGMAFCGWVCPQNSLSEWADHVTRRWLGKRVEVSLDGRPVRTSLGKNKKSHWFFLGLLFLLMAMAGALIPLLYFYPPDVIWSFLTFRDDVRLAPSLYWIYTMFTLILWVNIAFIRHFWCRFMCVYRIWQHAFKTRETLRIQHDTSHPDECARCNYCVTSCFIGIDPRDTETFDACINCGECITACSQIRQSRKTGGGLLRFALGRDGASKEDQRHMTNVGSIMARAPGAAALAAFGLIMFGWGLWSYDDFHFSVYRAETLQGGVIRDYRINIANKLYRPRGMSVTVEGLPKGGYHLTRDRASFTTAGRQDINLHIDDGLDKGVYPVLIKVHSDDGQQQIYRIQHLVLGGNPNG